MTGLAEIYPPIPSPLGTEQFVATPQAGGAAVMSLAQIGGALGPFRNAVIGGDFSTNPWQRGTSFTGITNSITFLADRFFAIGTAATSISASKQAIAAGDIAFDGGDRFSHALQYGRAAANASAAVCKMGHLFETLDSLPFQGKQVVLSFWAKKGANFSPNGGKLNLIIATGTGTDQTSSNLVNGSMTNYAAQQLYTAVSAQVPTGANAGGNPNSTLTQEAVLTPVDGVSLTSAWQRHQVTCLIPSTATQIGLLFQITPVGTAGANDWYQIAGVQFEAATPEVPFAGPFQFLPAAIERQRCLRYAYVLNEKATVAAVQANGMMSATNVQTVCIPLPLPMRTTPTVTVVAGTWRFNIAGVLTAVGGGFAAGAAATQSPEAINVVGAVTATVGDATQLVSGAATWGGSIVASAEL